MNPAEVLERAADAIDKYGHTKHELGAVGSPMCLLGAINFVATGNPQDNTEMYPKGDGWHACNQLRDTLSMSQNSALFGLILWNNAYERTAAEVTSTMRAAAASWRMQNEMPQLLREAEAAK